MFTEIRVTPVNEGRLRAYVVVCLEGRWYIKDLKVIEKDSGELFVSMPNRMYREKCTSCRHSNTIRASYCNWCGTGLVPKEGVDVNGVPQLYFDIIHPSGNGVRESATKEIIEAYKRVVSGEELPASPPPVAKAEPIRRQGMLVLSRKEGEFIWIGRDIKVVVGRSSAGRVELRIEAPSKYRILRGPELISEDGVAVRQEGEQA